MIRDAADCEADYQRFITRVSNSETVWALENESRVAYCESDDDEGYKIDGEPRSVLLFWSDRGYASRAKQQSFPEYDQTEISLFDFVFRWLPGMAGDGVLAGPNWTGHLVGLEIEPADLKDGLFETMGERRVAEYRNRLAAILDQKDGSE